MGRKGHNTPVYNSCVCMFISRYTVYGHMQFAIVHCMSNGRHNFPQVDLNHNGDT